MDNRERESHKRGVYPTQDTQRTETARMKQEEEEADARILVKEKYEKWKKGPWARRGIVSNKT